MRFPYFCLHSVIVCLHSLSLYKVKHYWYDLDSFAGPQLYIILSLCRLIYSWGLLVLEFLLSRLSPYNLHMSRYHHIWDNHIPLYWNRWNLNELKLEYERPQKTWMTRSEWTLCFSRRIVDPYPQVWTRHLLWEDRADSLPIIGASSLGPHSTYTFFPYTF